MHPFEDVQGYAGFTAQNFWRVCGPLPKAPTLCMRSNTGPYPIQGYPILNAPRLMTRALEGLLCTQ